MRRRAGSVPDGAWAGFRGGWRRAEWAKVLLCALTAGASVLGTACGPRRSAARAQAANLPYATIVHPQFVSAAQATFMSPRDLLVGVAAGATAKAYPAAILAQHGVVQDQMSDGPIAVTW